jgi:hypothetical protein
MVSLPITAVAFRGDVPSGDRGRRARRRLAGLFVEQPTVWMHLWQCLPGERRLLPGVWDRRCNMPGRTDVRASGTLLLDIDVRLSSRSRHGLCRRLLGSNLLGGIDRSESVIR